jgi:hypothetical protein
MPSHPDPTPAPERQGVLRPLALLAAALACLAACVQTDPGSPAPSGGSGLEDKGRVAGSTSSTNWPTEHGQPRVVKVRGRLDSVQTLVFFEFQNRPPVIGDLPVKLSGVLRFYPAGVIPALTTPRFTELAFAGADTLRIPGAALDSLVPEASDSLAFNIHIIADSLECWLLGFTYSGKTGRVSRSPLPDSSATPVFFKAPTYYYRGNLKVDTNRISPVAGESEFCFYIPGTPIFGKVKPDSSILLGPMPKGMYPLRLMRVTHLATEPPKTQVEAWEVQAGIEIDGTLVPGQQVFSVRTEGVLNLRDPE